MFFLKSVRHMVHPFGRRRLVSRFIRLSDMQQLLLLFCLVLGLNSAIFMSGFGVFMLVR